MSKVTVVGAGEVGASCVACLADRDVVNQIVLLDVKQGLAEGKALDLRQSAALKRFDTGDERLFGNGRFGCGGHHIRNYP